MLEKYIQGIQMCDRNEVCQKCDDEYERFKNGE